LQHAWFASLVKPSIILEEDEDAEFSPPLGSDSTESEESALPETGGIPLPNDVVDREVAEWVVQAIEKRRQGKLGHAAKPALHTAPLDAVNTPGALSEKKQMHEGKKEEASAATVAVIDDATAHVDAETNP
jgi:mitogen-activated protein kinase kinase